MWLALIVLAVAAIELFGSTQSFGQSLGLGSFSLGNLSASQIKQYAAAAGFSGDDLNTAVAIALAESSGNPNANGDTSLTPGGSVGLWQIDLAAHPDLAALNLTDPQTNAEAAFVVYTQAGYSFHPWSTFKSGAFSQYLGEAEAA